MIPKGQTNLWAYTVELSNLAPTELETCQIIKYSVCMPFIKQHLYWPNFLQVIFSMCVFIPQMVNNPILCAAIMTLACSTSRLPNYFKCLWNCDCYAPCFDSSCLFTYFGFFGIHYNSSVGLAKSTLQNVKSQYQYVYWKGNNTRASGIRDSFPQLLNCVR
jgi:hypothetical protein